MANRGSTHSQDANEREPLLNRGGQADGETQNANPDESIDKEWDATDNKQNPRNWANWFKWTMVALVSYIEFLTTMPNFMYAPNITDAEKDLGTSNDTLATFSLTIYVLGFGFGPFLFAPLSEVFGRRRVYQLCLAAFLAGTFGCGLSQNIEMLVAFRFVAGVFGAAPVAIGGAVVGDLFPPETRGTAMSVYQAGQIISAVVGPPIGGLIGSYLVWRWVFWIVCMLAGIALSFTLIFMKETHAPTLKYRIYSSGSPDTFGKTGLAKTLWKALIRPGKLLIYSPVVALGCILIFIVIGLLNVFLTELSRTVQKIYHVSSGQSGYMYFGMAFGFLGASILFALTNDRVMHALASRYNGDIRPEFRLPATIVAMPVVAIGTLWYGWTLQYKTQWIIPVVGSGVAGLGITTVQLSITTYMVDSFDDFSASALADVTMARSIGGAIVPLLGPSLYAALDQGWGNTVLALITLVLCFIPIVMYMFGGKWRHMYTSEDLKTSEEES